MTYPPDPIPMNEVPSLEPVNGVPNVVLVPAQWSCTALLMPFSPPQPDKPVNELTPFFQLCTANLAYSEGEYFSLQIKGSESGTFWYMFTPNSAQVSINGGDFEDIPDTSGWAMPGQNWLGSQSSKFVGLGPMNWIEKKNNQSTGWWKGLNPGSSKEKPGANWIWCHPGQTAGTFLPKRMMFGTQPPSPTQGHPELVPVLQNFSFSYFSDAVWGAEKPEAWSDPVFPGFRPGNPDKAPIFSWARNQGITALMTPVNEKFDPMPTRVLYRWDPDKEFENGGTRGQSSLLHYPPTDTGDYSLELAILTRESPTNKPHGFNAFYFNERAKPTGTMTGKIDTSTSKPLPSAFSGAQPPDWVKLGQGKIHGVLKDNPDFCPGLTLNIWGVHFPKSEPNYPDNTYLWTWQHPVDSSGTLCRPVVFMQSSSALGVGTSLALADYFGFEDFGTDNISADFFSIPPPDYLKFS